MQRNAGSLQKPKKAGKLIPSQSLQKECSLANPFQIFYLQNHEIINLCCFRPSNLWSFETVGIENLYSVLTCGHISLLPVHDLSVLVTQLCLTLFNHMNYSPASLLSPCVESPGKNTGVGSHFLLQGILPTQGWNLGLLHWQADSLLSKPAGKSL